MNVISRIPDSARNFFPPTRFFYSLRQILGKFARFDFPPYGGKFPPYDKRFPPYTIQFPPYVLGRRFASVS